jgi:hypothetical protein
MNSAYGILSIMVCGPQWITRAALGGVPESLAKRFVNHASSQVHAIYQKITATDLMPMLDALALYRRPSVPPSELVAKPLNDRE